ncbi:MAG: hypothetical protein MJ091_07105, partial [Clostridia bacterium]|nr:hypothetical protein [Clostridia bacterium]
AVSDLALGLILVPIIVAVGLSKTDKKLAKRWWLYFLITLDIACILGFVAHYYCTSPISNRIIWIPLFTIMYEIFNCFFLACVAVATDDARPHKKDVVSVHLVSLACYILTHIIIGVFSADSIMVMTCFNTVLAIAGFVLLVKRSLKKGNIGERIIISSLVPLLPAAYFQIKRKGFVHIIWDFDQNGISHIFIILGVILVFVGIYVILKRKRKGDTV